MMNKNWFQFIDGGKVVWPENELPHPKTIFKADFINQFIGWCKYLDHIDNNLWDPQGTLGGVEFAEVGTIIQEADFWNKLIFTPRAPKIFDPPAWSWGWAWGLTADELKDVGTSPKLSSLVRPVDHPEWPDHPVEPFSRGDNLQGSLRQWLFNLRWRIDNSTACYGGHSHYALSRMTYKYWSGLLDGTDRKVSTEYYANYPWIIPTLIAHTSASDLSEFGYSDVFSDISISSTPHADASLLVNFAGTGSTPLINFPTPPHTEVYVLATARPPAVMYSGSIPSETMPYWGCGDVEWSVDISTVIIPDADLPSVFTPEG